MERGHPFFFLYIIILFMYDISSWNSLLRNFEVRSELQIMNTGVCAQSLEAP